MQSLITLAFSAGFFGLSFLVDYRLRGAHVAAGLAVLLALVIVVPLRLDVPTGDTHNFVEDLEHFQSSAGITEIQFQFHLGASIVGNLWEARGAIPDPEHWGDAFSGYVMLAATVYLAGAAAVGFLERWSPASLRYISLATAAPALLLFFGYREYAFELLAPAVLAFPLLITGLDAPSPWRLRAGAALLGLGAALHGYALYGMLTGLLIVLLYDSAWRTRAERVIEFGMYSVAAYLVWVPLYMIIENIPLIPGHAEEVQFRPLFEEKFVKGNIFRTAYPIFTSWEGFREVGLMYICGGALLYVPAAIANVAHRIKLPVLLAVIPAMILLAGTWPPQGIGNDTDVALGIFPAIFALAWLASRDPRSSAIGWVLLALGHIFFWNFMVTEEFVVGRD